jgi:predicted amidohydrolase YtcJ
MRIITLVALLLSVTTQAGEPVAIYTAAEIITMESDRPRAEAVAVADGRIVAVGSQEEIQQQLGGRPYRVDSSFADKVLMPGLIDNHLHPSMAAVLLPMAFITPFDWQVPGQSVKGVQGREAYLQALQQKETETKGDEWLFTWGYHHYFHGGISRQDLDGISSRRPIIVWHRSFHEIYVNTPALKALDITADKVAGHPHIDWDKGHFYETALPFAFAHLGPKILAPNWFRGGLESVREAVHRGGVTTIADMAAGMFGLNMEWPHLKAVLDSEQTPFRTLMIPSAASFGGAPGDEQSMHTISGLPERNSEKLKFVKQVKLLADGAFFSQLMQMNDPGYLDGHHGEWLMEPELLENAARAYWQAGYQLHIHSNGDKGTEVVLDILEKLQQEHPKDDHRTTLHHLGYSTEAQSARMAELGALVSANPYYLYALGDKYSEIGLGAERASEIVRAGSLVKHGVPLSLHSDFTMAPVEPLTLAWVAANRKTAAGTEMASDLKLTLDQALRAVTIDAAHAIRMEQEVGSIAVGKKADFTVLEADPYRIPLAQLKDISIWGTVFEGQVFPIAR